MNEERLEELKKDFEFKHTSGIIKIPKEYFYYNDDASLTFEFCESCEKPVHQIDLGDGVYGCEYCKSANQITIINIEENWLKNDVEKETKQETNLLETELKILKEQRLTEQSLKESYNRLKTVFEEQNKDLIEQLKKAGEIRSTVEERIRELAVSEYEASGEKKLFGGVGIRVLSKLEYDEAEALIWAKEHSLCLRLDKSGFEKLAKVEDIGFVKKVEKITATIPTKIKLGEE